MFRRRKKLIEKKLPTSEIHSNEPRRLCFLTNRNLESNERMCTMMKLKIRPCINFNRINDTIKIYTDIRCEWIYVSVSSVCKEKWMWTRVWKISYFTRGIKLIFRNALTSIFSNICTYNTTLKTKFTKTFEKYFRFLYTRVVKCRTFFFISNI